MITRHVFADGTTLVEIHCGCCGLYFMATPGGKAFCEDCVLGIHKSCKRNEIMGISN